LIQYFLKFGNRALIATLETLAVLFLLLLLAFGAFVWRVSEGPLSIRFAKDYIQSALSDEHAEMYVSFNDIVFTWPEVSGPFRLDVKGLRVQKGKLEANALNVDDASIGLSRTALLFGRIRPVSVIIKSPSLELVRERDGHLNLFVQNSEVKSADDDNEAKTPANEQIANVFKDMASRQRRGGNFLSRLDEFVIEDASLAVRDHEYGLSWYLDNFDFSIKEHPQGVAASVVASLPGGREKNAGLALDMVYRKNSNDFRAAGLVNEVNPYAVSRFLPVPEILSGQDFFFSGEFDAAMDENMLPTYVKFAGAVPEGMIDIPAQFEAPIHLKNIAIATEYKSTDEMLTLSNLSGEINGIPFTGSGKAAITENSITAPIQLKVASAKREAIPPLFPKAEQDGQAYEWLAKRIEGGTFHDVELNTEVTAKKTRNEELNREEWHVDVPQLLLDFAFEDASVEYHPTLMRASEAKGKGTLDLAAQTLTIEGESAKLGDIQGNNVKVVVTDIITRGGGYVTVNTHINGPLATALKYIAADPINMDKTRIGIDADAVKGNAELDVTVALPTTKEVLAEEVKVDVNGTLSDVEIPGIVKGLTLSGGPLTVATEEGGFRIKGNAKLAGRDTTMEWHQYFTSAGKPYSMQVKAKIGADQELRSHFGVNLDDYISGTMPVDVVYTHKGTGVSQVDVKGDLNPMRVHIKTFKFEKPVGVPGTMSATAHLKDDVLKELVNINVQSRDISASNATIKFAPMNGKQADLSSGKLGDVTLGRTKMNVSFDVQNNVMKVTANGATLDAMPFLQETESSHGNLGIVPAKKKVQAMTVAVTADNMLTKNEQVTKNNKIYLELDTEGELTQIEYDGIVGKSPLLVRFKPDETGKRVFRLESNDAGNVLYASGLYDNAHGGRLLIYGEPKGNNLRGDLHGSMRMENFRVTKAPALASLLSLMSLTGVTQMLGNEGLVFSKLESEFEWRFRPEGNLLVIKDGKTSGSSIGLTFDGVINRGTKTTDIGGTIIPMTEINSFLSKIPLLGNILGGETGLIAATYTMKGPSSKPTVMVNPLSVLAPGFLRNILFESGYKNKIPGDEKEGSEPQAAPPAATSRTGASSSVPANNNLGGTLDKPKTN
jgi:hypothetical protein